MTLRFASVWLAILCSLPAHAQSPFCEWAIQTLASREELRGEIARLSQTKTVHRVEMFDYKKVEGNEACATSAVVTCIGVIIINRKTNVAYLGHYVHDGPHPKTLVELARQEAGSGADLEIILTGGQVPVARGDKDFPAFAASTRRFNQSLLDSITAAGVPEKNLRNRMREDEAIMEWDIVVDAETRRVLIAYFENAEPLYEEE